MRLLLFALVFAPMALAQPLVLDDGAYQLIRAQQSGAESGNLALFSDVVQISHKEGKIFIAFGDHKEVEVRTDDQQGFLVALPYGPSEKGSLALELVLAGTGMQLYPLKGTSSMRVDGESWVIWTRGVQKGRFSLVPLEAKKG